MARCLIQFLPLLAGMVALAVLSSEATASFVLPGTLPEAASVCSACPGHNAPGPANGQPGHGFWRGILHLGFLLLTNVAEVSPTGCQETVSQIGCLFEQKIFCAEPVSWLAAEERAL